MNIKQLLDKAADLDYKIRVLKEVIDNSHILSRDTQQRFGYRITGKKYTVRVSNPEDLEELDRALNKVLAAWQTSQQKVRSKLDAIENLIASDT